MLGILGRGFEKSGNYGFISRDLRQIFTQPQHLTDIVPQKSGLSGVLYDFIGVETETSP